MVPSQILVHHPQLSTYYIRMSLKSKTSFFRKHIDDELKWLSTPRPGIGSNIPHNQQDTNTYINKSNIHIVSSGILRISITCAVHSKKIARNSRLFRFCSHLQQRKHCSPALLTLVKRIHSWLVYSFHWGPTYESLFISWFYNRN